MSDFLKYWDTRIDANERFFNKYPHIANFAFSEAQLLHEHMKEEIDTLRATVAKMEALSAVVRPVIEEWLVWRAWVEDGNEEPLTTTEKISFAGVPKIAASKVTVAQMDALVALVGEEGK